MAELADEEAARDILCSISSPLESHKYIEDSIYRKYTAA
jgi:hypothetical protein